MSAVDMSGTADLPDAQALSAAATDIQRFGQRFSVTLDDAHRQWMKLTRTYRAPEQEEVYAAMDQPRATASGLSLTLAAAARALESFATEAALIRHAREQLQADITAHEAAPLGRDTPARTLDLQGRARGLASWLESAEGDCISALSRLERSGGDATARYRDADRPDGGAVLNAGTRYDQATIGTGDDPGAFNRYLGLLATLGPSQFKEFLATNPGMALVVPPKAAGADPVSNRRWWDGLDQRKQALLSEKLPSLVGNLQGLDYGTRAAANATALGLAAERTFATDLQREAYRNINKSLQDGSRIRGERRLVSFNAAHPPLAAVAIGDLDSADNVTFNVPGMGSNTGDMSGWAEASQNIYNTQNMYLPVGHHSVVAWIGYDSPDAPPSLEVNHIGPAEKGGQQLRAELEGFHATRTSGDGKLPFTSVAAHSYGSTTAAVALSLTNFEVDAVAFYGSAGIDPDISDEVSDLHVADARDGEPAVYATAATKDHTARLGINLSGGFTEHPRISPTASDFGTKVFSSEGTADLSPTKGHSALGEEGATWWYAFDTPQGRGYLDEKTESLDSIARIVGGGGDDVETTKEAIVDMQDSAMEDSRKVQVYGPR